MMILKPVFRSEGVVPKFSYITNKIILQPRLMCGIRECFLRDEYNTITVKKWLHSDMEFSKFSKIDVAGNFYLSAIGWQGAIGYRDDNTHKFDTYLHNPRGGFIRKNTGLEIGTLSAGINYPEKAYLPVVRLTNKLAVRRMNTYQIYKLKERMKKMLEGKWRFR